MKFYILTGDSSHRNYNFAFIGEDFFFGLDNGSVGRMFTYDALSESTVRMMIDDIEHEYTLIDIIDHNVFEAISTTIVHKWIEENYPEYIL